MGGACWPSSHRLPSGRFWVLRVGMASSSGLATASRGEFLSPTHVSFDPVCPSAPFPLSFRSLISPIFFFFLSDIFPSVQGTQAPFFLCVVPTLDLGFSYGSACSAVCVYHHSGVLEWMWGMSFVFEVPSLAHCWCDISK